MASSTPTQAVDRYGQWLPLSATDPATVEARKTAWLAAIATGSGVWKACEQSGMAIGSLYLWAESDPELAAGIDQAKRNRLAELEHKLDEVIEHPAEYDQALQRPSWMNAIMFRTKYLEPGYRDNAQVNVNVGVQVNSGDIDQAAAEYFQRKNGKR